MRSDRGDREEVPNYVIAITDGGANINRERTIPSAIEARIKVKWLYLCYSVTYQG